MYPSRVKAIAAWLAVSSLFVSINALAAALMFGLWKLAEHLDPQLVTLWWVVLPLGAIGVALSIWACWFGLRTLERMVNARPRQRPARDRGSPRPAPTTSPGRTP